MKVGILTFNKALNFGANLQACSTYCYLKNHGYDPVFVNYSPLDAANEEKNCPNEQVVVQRQFQNQFNVTEACYDSKAVAEALRKNEIHNVIIGSDAVAQHHPLLARIVFPSKRFISVMHPSQDKMFPNPFWGEFLKYMDGGVSVCLMSVSNQQSRYRCFAKKDMEGMMEFLPKFKYISVRDDWTQSMYKYISKGTIIPEITPDPVFAFNYNVPFIPTKEEIVQKFGLPEKYVLLALNSFRTISSTWVSGFEKICKKYGYTCIGLPFPFGFNKNNVTCKKAELPLSPIEWYALIKYSNGYVGHNMHTIVSALHNAVPCFCMDQYGRRFLSQFVIKRSSKIYHILNTAGFPDYRSPSCTVIDMTPSPQKVFDKLMSFDQEKCKKFSISYYEKYKTMMEKIESTFI